MRSVALCAVLALAACGGGGSTGGGTIALPSGSGLVVSWVSRSGPAGGSGTQADAIHLASPSNGVVVTASRGGITQQFNLATDPSCTAVSVATNTVSVGVVGDPNAPLPVTIVPGGPGVWDVTWNVVSVSKGTCSVNVTTMDGAKATLQVFSEL